MLTPLPLSVLRSRLNDYTKTEIMSEPQQHVSTVTIPLSEYNEMRRSLELLNKALENNEVAVRETPTPYSYETRYRTFTRDEALNRIAEKYYQLEDKYRELQKQNNKLASDFNGYTEATLWTRIMRVFNKQY
jgi:hypothetical protein